MKRALIALIVAIGAPAHAEPTGAEVDEARRLAARAEVAFDLGEYGVAIADYQAAYRLHPSPGLLYNLAQAYRLSGDCVSATTMYRSYLRLEPHSKVRHVATQHLSSLEECYRLHTGTVLAASGDERGTRLASLSFDPLSGGMIDDAEENPGRTRKILGVAVGSGGVAVVLAGVYVSALAARTADEVTARYADGDPWEEIEALDRRGRRQEAAGVALLVGGGAALAAGATLYALGWRDDRRASSVTLTPAGKGAAVSVSWGW